MTIRATVMATRKRSTSITTTKSSQVGRRWNRPSFSSDASLFAITSRFHCHPNSRRNGGILPFLFRIKKAARKPLCHTSRPVHITGSMQAKYLDRKRFPNRSPPMRRKTPPSWRAWSFSLFSWVWQYRRRSMKHWMLPRASQCLNWWQRLDWSMKLSQRR